MPRFLVSIERPRNEFLQVVVEAENEEAAEEAALAADFDPLALDWQDCDPGDPEVTDVEPVGEDEPLTPILKTSP